MNKRFIIIFNVVLTQKILPKGLSGIKSVINSNSLVCSKNGLVRNLATLKSFRKTLAKAARETEESMHVTEPASQEHQYLVAIL